MLSDFFSVSALFKDDNWRLHPDWVYCQYNYAGDRVKEFDSPEATLRHFVALSQSKQKEWNWGTPRVRPLPKCTNMKHFDPNCIKCE
jgi:hypothetical protein